MHNAVFTEKGRRGDESVATHTLGWLCFVLFLFGGDMRGIIVNTKN